MCQLLGASGQARAHVSLLLAMPFSSARGRPPVAALPLPARVSWESPPLAVAELSQRGPFRAGVGGRKPSSTNHPHHPRGRSSSAEGFPVQPPDIRASLPSCLPASSGPLLDQPSWEQPGDQAPQHPLSCGASLSGGWLGLRVPASAAALPTRAESTPALLWGWRGAQESGPSGVRRE